MRVLMLPDWRGGNPYQNLLNDAVQAQGDEVAFSDFPDAILPLQAVLRSHPGVQVLHLHWVNSLIAPAVWASSPLKRWIRRALLKLDLMLTRLRGVRVVWTVHNFTAHESQDAGAELRTRSVLAQGVSHLIVHSQGALAKLRQGWGRAGLDDPRVSIVRHGNFLGCYPADPGKAQALRQAWAPEADQIVILFFGAVRPYKGLERLMKALAAVPDPRLRLVIAGRPHDPKFGAQVQRLAQLDPRIAQQLVFIPESDVWAYYAAADVVAVPLEQTLTSGSAVLAMTMGKPVLMPSTTRHLDLGGSECVLEFDGQAELEQLLTRLHTLDLEAMGRACEAMAARWSWSEVGRLTTMAYREQSLASSTEGVAT